MSESTSAPAAPAADAVTTPAPANAPGISISDAARLLNQQRRQQAGEPPAPANDGRKPAPSAAQPAAPAAPAPPAPAAPALSALERALAPGGELPPAANTNAPAQPVAQFDIEGRAYSQVELREAVLKAADYTVKTQELATGRQQLAQQRQALDAQAQALATVLPYIQPELQRLAETVNQTAQMPDPALAESDPAAYVRQRALYDQAVAEQNRLGSLTQLQQQAQARAMEQAVAHANETLAREYPFWADPAERATAQAQIVQWATTQGGFDRNELRNLASAHHLKTMMKAMAYDKWIASAKTTAPTSLTSAPTRGTPPPPAPAAAVQQAQDAFAERATIRSGAALLAARRAAQH